MATNENGAMRAARMIERVEYEQREASRFFSGKAKPRDFYSPATPVPNRRKEAAAAAGCPERLTVERINAMNRARRIPRAVALAAAPLTRRAIPAVRVLGISQ